MPKWATEGYEFVSYYEVVEGGDLKQCGKLKHQVRLITWGALKQPVDVGGICIMCMPWPIGLVSVFCILAFFSTWNYAKPKVTISLYSNHPLVYQLNWEKISLIPEWLCYTLEKGINFLSRNMSSSPPVFLYMIHTMLLKSPNHHRITFSYRKLHSSLCGITTQAGSLCLSSPNSSHC